MRELSTMRIVHIPTITVRVTVRALVVGVCLAGGLTAATSQSQAAACAEVEAKERPATVAMAAAMARVWIVFMAWFSLMWAAARFVV